MLVKKLTSIFNSIISIKQLFLISSSMLQINYLFIYIYLFITVPKFRINQSKVTCTHVSTAPLSNAKSLTWCMYLINYNFGVLWWQTSLAWSGLTVSCQNHHLDQTGLMDVSQKCTEIAWSQMYKIAIWICCEPTQCSGHLICI